MTNTAKKKVGADLTQGSVLTGLVLFAIPIVITNLIQQLYSMVDLMIIGQFAGVTGTVGVSTGGEISDFLTPVATALSTAGQIYIAQLAGAKREKDLKDAIGSFITLMLIISVALLAVTLLFRTQILNALNCPTEAFTPAMNYLIITAIGFPFIYCYNSVCGVLRGMGESKRPLLFIAIAAVVNIFLDLIFVVVFQMGAAGTAIATVMSQAASFLAAFIYMYRCREQFDFELKFSYLKMKKQHVKVILQLGIPQACRSILVRFSILWVNANVNAYGLIASSTNGVGNKLQKFLEIYSSSFSQAGGAMIGQNLGAQKHQRARQVVYYTCAICLALSAITAVIIYFWPKAVFGIFTRDADVLEMGVIYLHIMIFHIFASAVTSSFQCMVIGSGNATLNFIIGVLDGVVCKIGLSILFANILQMEAIGYFWGTALSRVLPGILCILYFYSGKWATKNLIKE